MTAQSPQILFLLELLCVFSECTVPCGTKSIPTASLSAETSHLNSMWVVFSRGCDASVEQEPDSGAEKVAHYAGKCWWCIKKISPLMSFYFCCLVQSFLKYIHFEVWWGNACLFEADGDTWMEDNWDLGLWDKLLHLCFLFLLIWNAHKPHSNIIITLHFP